MYCRVYSVSASPLILGSSGEFHTFRLPVPDLWLDIFQKMVAAGLNGVSIYIHCMFFSYNPFSSSPLTVFIGGLTNPAPGVIDFEDWRALQPIFDAAKLAGLFIVLRPGTLLFYLTYHISKTHSLT